MTKTASILRDAVIVDEWWKNRGGESIRVRLTTYEGRDLIDVRTFYTADDGVLKPGKGFCSSIKHRPRLAAAITKAEAKAREIGLIPEDADADKD